MKNISFKILVLFIVLPPVLYLLSINFLENYLNNHYDKDIRNVYLSDITDILNGLTPLQGGINTSIESYLKKNIFVKLGGNLNITITSKQGNIIYPATYQNPALNSLGTDPVKLARDNFNILNKGLLISVDVKIKHYSFIAVALLVFYFLVFLGGLYAYYRNVSKKIQAQEAEKNKELFRLRELEQNRLKEIHMLSREREALLTQYDRLHLDLEKEKIQAEKTEEDLFDEIDALEKKLARNLSLQQHQHLRIDKLKEEIDGLDKTRKHITRQKDKAVEKLGKRYKILYKNIDITNRALDSLTDMTEEMNLKAEELIHQLNDDSSLVPVKRKIFSKKGKTTSFEVVFAYNGRLYFRKTKENRIEILTLGSKNTQAKDLIFLDNI